MSVECERVHGINLAQGVCDTDVPEVVAAAVDKAVRAGCNSYTRHDGVARLRKALAMKLSRDNALNYDPENQIVVSAGSTGSFYCAAMALLSPGDEVILFEPFYGYHLSTLQAVEAKAVYAKLHAPDWTFDPAELEGLITKRTRAIMVCTPSNPCGKVWTKTELEWLAGFAEKPDLVVFTGEIYPYKTPPRAHKKKPRAPPIEGGGRGVGGVRRDRTVRAKRSASRRVKCAGSLSSPPSASNAMP